MVAVASGACSWGQLERSSSWLQQDWCLRSGHEQRLLLIGYLCLHALITNSGLRLFLDVPVLSVFRCVVALSCKEPF